MIKLVLFAVLCTVVYAKHGYGDYSVHYGFTAGGYGGHHGHGYGHGHGHGHGHVNVHQNPHHYQFGVKEHNGKYHWQTAATPYGYGHGGYGHGHGYHG